MFILTNRKQKPKRCTCGALVWPNFWDRHVKSGHKVGIAQEQSYEEGGK